MKKKPRKKPNSISEQLRGYLKDCGLSTYRLEREIGIHNSVLSRFLRGERGLSLGAIDALSKYLKLRLVQDEH